MEVLIREDSRVAEVWLSKTEKADSIVQALLKRIIQDHKSKGYLVAVFLSGEEDIYTQTRDILCYNRKRIAQLEVQQEKVSGKVM